MINYLVGDALCPPVLGHKLIVHICNDAGGFGAGFAKAVATKYPDVQKDYYTWFKYGSDFSLGQIRPRIIQKYITIINMLAQHGYSKPNKPAIRYDALRLCLEKVAKYVEKRAVVCIDNTYYLTSIHMPRIGCGLAGGKWDQIEPIIEDTLKGFDVYVYDLK